MFDDTRTVSQEDGSLPLHNERWGSRITADDTGNDASGGSGFCDRVTPEGEHEDESRNFEWDEKSLIKAGNVSDKDQNRGRWGAADKKFQPTMNPSASSTK